MEQIEDLDSYSCKNPKRRMTLISITEATRQQTRDPNSCREREEEVQLQIEEDSNDGSRFVFIFFLVILFC
jgi:hypothetical protein